SYAVSSCGDLSISDGIVDSQGLSSSVVGSFGNIVSNGNIKVTGGTINGDAAAGPAKTITTSGSGKITGTRSNESSAYNCTPVDLAALAATLQSANDDSKLPLTGQGKNALGGTTHTDFNLSGGDTIHFPAGTYYFTKFTVSGGSTITIDGPVRILCTGTVSISGGSFVNTDPYRLRFLCSGTQFTISGGSAMVGFVYAPQAAATVSASRLFGSIFAQTVTVSGSAHVTRAIDDVPPRVAITAPANNAIFSDGSKIAVAGTAADDQTALTLKVNGNDVAINADGSWTTTLNLSAAGSPVTITALATDVAGNTATATVTIQIIPPPVITLVSPPNGALVNTRSVTLTGSAGTAAAVTVNGQSAALVSGTWTIQNFDLGNDGAHALTIVGTNAGGATTISATITNDTAAPTIQGTFTPAPNADGWNNTNVTVTFACADSGSGIATCQAPITVSTEGANQTITGTATDKAGNQKTVSVTVKLDATAPQVAITAPANGTSVSSPSLSVSGAASDALSGLAGVTCNGAAATVSGGSFTCTVMLSAGDDAITVRATDLAGNSATDSRHVSLATLNSISVSPASASIVVGGTVALAAQATYSDGTTRDVTAAAAWSSSAANVANVSGGAVNAIGSGTAVITATLNGISGSATVTVTKPAPTFTAINVLPSSATLQRGATQQLTATATYSDDSTADVTAQSTWTTSASAVATVAATGLVTAAGEGSAVITATLASTSGTATITVPPSEPLPPDPATVAPPIDATAGANVHESTRFLYEGTNSIQTGVAPNTIDPLRAAVIRGRVIQRGGSPLAAVHITILGHGEYGRTLTRADGQFDCAVNGGGAITVQYRKDGYV
ncbi:MAG TPA: Ig-like domain-containing protein, partial [Thermoanaerobaculia bacterium]|nr:Ig-like domain-containing protein [Thermoanaerobaculia bacterium]